MQLFNSLATVSAALTTTTTSPFMWYVTRAAAVSAYVVLAVTVILGLGRSLVRVAHVRASKVVWLLDEAHPYLAVLAAAFVALHLVTLLLDALIPFSSVNLLVPIDEPYRPLAVTLGVFGFYALLIVWLSSWARRFLGHTAWRALHYTSFVAFVLVSAHGILAGSDSGESWMLAIYMTASALVGLLMLTRIFWPSQKDSKAAQRVAEMA